MKTVLRSKELTCPSCIAKIEKALTAVDGVETAKVFFNSDSFHSGLPSSSLSSLPENGLRSTLFTESLPLSIALESSKYRKVQGDQQVLGRRGLAGTWQPNPVKDREEVSQRISFSMLRKTFKKCSPRDLSNSASHFSIFCASYFGFFKRMDLTSSRSLALPAITL